MLLMYDFKSVELRWQTRWERDHLYRTADESAKPKYYTMEMWPYPSGDLHVGHAKNYTLGDVVARMMRMLGYNVLHPMGWDAFGLPAENAAIDRGIDPAVWTTENILNMRRQIRLMGTGYDWSREIATCEPEYYRWNQWLFVRLFENGLAYKREAPVNWCPHDRTVLANEQVIDGRCWRCDHLVERRNLSQWFLRITAYADRLLDDLANLSGWPERTRTMQRNWIGRSEGANVAFAVDGMDESIEVFTTRLDTLYGATFLARRARAPAGRTAQTNGFKRAGGSNRRFRRELEIQNGTRAHEPDGKTGRLHRRTRHQPALARTHPDMADELRPCRVRQRCGDGRARARRARFRVCQEAGLADRRGHRSAHGESNEPLHAAYVEDGRLIASDDFSEMSSERAREAIAERLTATGAGGKSVGYKLRDWLISRQRYWGTPIPIVHCPQCGEVAVPDDQLPILLPPRERISGEEPGPSLSRGSPLASIPEFIETVCPKCGEKAKRESDTMDTFFESSWYYLRYLDPHNDELPWASPRADRWMNVDQYIGGTEHTVLHLLYSRFFYKFFHDRGWVSGSDEPFQRLFHQGLVLHDGEKMSKSRGNVVGIDQTAEQIGVDAMRLFLLYVTPPEETSNWSEEGISGRVRLLGRIWRACEPHFDAIARRPAGLSKDCPRPRTRSEKGALACGAPRREVRDRRDDVAPLPLQHHHREARRARQSDDRVERAFASDVLRGAQPADPDRAVCPAHRRRALGTSRAHHVRASRALPRAGGAAPWQSRKSCSSCKSTGKYARASPRPSG